MNTRSKSTTALLNLVKAAVFAALIAVMTAYIKFNTGINDGYLHFGDSMIYLAACILPLPYAMAAAAIGGFCADILAGAAAWAPFTAIIKALNVLPFALFGYLLAEGLLYSFPTALTSVPFSIIQAVGSAIIYYIAAPALDKVKFKTKLS